MTKKIDYASMFTLRADGRYAASIQRNGKRKWIYDKDPECLYHRLKDLEEGRKQEPSLSEVSEGWEPVCRSRISERTWANMRPHVEEIRELYGNLRISEITAQLVMTDLLRAKEKGYSFSVVNTRRVIWSGICTHAILSNLIQYNPVQSVFLPKGLPKGRRRAPTDAEIRTICASIDKPFGLFPFFLLCTGMRKSEALALTVKDVDLELGIIRVVKSLTYIVGSRPDVKPPKSAAGYRVVPIIDQLAGPLRDHIKMLNGPVLFPSPSGGYMTERGYEGAWQRYCEAAGLINEDGRPTLTAHHMRHGTATLLFESDVDELTTKTILGHANITTTREIYTELREAQRAKNVEKFSAGMQQYMPTEGGR